MTISEHYKNTTYKHFFFKDPFIMNSTVSENCLHLPLLQVLNSLIVEWSKFSFSFQYQHIFKHTSGKNNDSHQLGNIALIYYQILIVYVEELVWQSLMGFSNLTLKKWLHFLKAPFLSYWTCNKYSKRHFLWYRNWWHQLPSVCMKAQRS